MATNREKQILRLIEANPLISQQELADTCNITRSSVAVHISNLMKKGFIQGKGYITSSKPHIAVIGGSTLEISGMPDAALVRKEANFGKVSTVLGGKGRNIAQNLAQLGENIKFVSVFGDDPYARPLIESCLQSGVDITDAPVVPGGTSSILMNITNGAGETQLSILDYELYAHITPTFLHKRFAVINNAALCVADGSLPEESIEFLAQNCSNPLFLDVAGESNISKIETLLQFVHTVKLTRAELAKLVGKPVKDERALQAAADEILAKGVQQIFVNLGTGGLYCANGKEKCLLPALPAKTYNPQGASDCFTAVVAWGYNQGFALADCGKLALVASAMTVESREAVNPGINEQNMLDVLKKLG